MIQRHGVRVTLVAAIAAAIVAVAGCESITERPETVGMGATLAGGRVRPDSVDTEGTGSVTAVLSSVPEFTYSITFSDLSDIATQVHLHGPADTSEAAPILLDLAALGDPHNGTIALGETTGSGSGTIDLTADISATMSGDSLHALLRAGRVYVDVHTATHGAGELRGQLVRH